MIICQMRKGYYAIDRWGWPILGKVNPRRQYFYSPEELLYNMHGWSQEEYLSEQFCKNI